MTTPQPTPETIPLDTPIVRGEQRITEITLRKPTAGELRGVTLSALALADVDALITVVPRISTPTLLKHDIAAMDPADLAVIGAKVIGFLTQKQPVEQSPAA